MKHKIIGLLFGLGVMTPLMGQKLPDVRVDQEAVTEESMFIEANRERLLGNYDVAEGKLNDVIKKYGKKAVFYYEMAKVYEEVGNIPKAMETNKTAIKIMPENEWYWQYQADLSIKIEDDESSIEAFSKLAELFPDRNYYLENIAFHQLRTDDALNALKTLNKLESRTGINYETTRKKHLIYDDMGKKKEAAAELDAFILQHPRDSRMANIAASYALKNKDKKKAIKYYEGVIQHYPDNAIAKGALLKLKNGGLSKSDQLTDYIEDRNVDLDDKIIQLIPIILDVQSGKSDFNAELLETLAISLIRQYGESDKTLALSADIYSIQNKLEEAVAQYIKSIEFSDGNYLVWEQLLYVLTDLKDAKRLAYYAEEATDLYPNKPLPVAFLALSSAMNNRNSDAAKYIRQAKMISGKNAELNAQVESLENLIEQLNGQ